MSEVVEPAKNRTSCDLCKRMKIRCEKQGDRCAHCISRDAECVVTIVPRKKRQKKTDYLSTLEDRLLKMEAVITAAAASSSSSVPASASASQTPEAVDDDDNDTQAALSEKLSSLYIGPSGDTKYLGTSSGFSLFSEQGLEWITKKTGGTQFSEMVKQLAKVTHKDPGDFSGPGIWYPMALNQHEPLPAPEVARSYINSFFTTFNKILPVLDEDVFERDYARRPSPAFNEDASWYAVLNMVIAVGSLISSTYFPASNFQRPINILNPDASGLICWKFFRNASSLYLDLSFGETNLMAVQALVLMSYMMQSIADPQPAYVCAAAAVRLAHAAGLHRKMAFTGLSESEMEQRSNVFWTLYMLEQGLSLRSGRPSMIQDDDIGIDLPKQTYVKDDGTFGGVEVMKTFPKTVELSNISSRVYSALYSAKSQSQSRLERLKLVGRFDKELEQWRDSIQIEIRPGEPIICDVGYIVPVIMLQFQYYFVLTTIHRVSVHHGYWMNERVQEDNQWAHDAQLNPRVFASGALCLSAARNTIRLFQHHNLQMYPFSENSNVLRMAHYFPLTSLLTLFANCLQHPQDENASSDIELMTTVMTIISGSVHSAADKTIDAIKVFEEIIRIARLFVTRARTQERHKRTHERLESKDEKPQMSRNSFASLAATTEGFDRAVSTSCSMDYATTVSTASYLSPNVAITSQTTHLPEASSDGFPHSRLSSSSLTEPLVPFDPNTLHSSPDLQTPSFDILPPSNTNNAIETNPPEASTDANNWWPGSTDSEFQQPPDPYIPFDPTLDDQDVLLWDPDAFMPMNMTFQWDLAELWTGKGKGATQTE